MGCGLGGSKVGPRKHALAVGACWRNLANTTEPSVFGGDATFVKLFSPPVVFVIFSTARFSVAV